MSLAYSGPPLRPGVIFDIARAAGIVVPERGGDKRPVRCPVHDDKHASAFLSVNNVFFCCVCTSDRGWSAKTLAEKLGLDWNKYARDDVFVAHHVTSDEPVFTAADAEVSWRLALARARDDMHVDADRDVYRFLIERQLQGSFEDYAFGILAAEQQLHTLIAKWPSDGYRLVAALYDLQGRLTNIQARAIDGREPRTKFPYHSTAKGTVFADSRARAILREESKGEHSAIFGEGLTDFLALTIVSPVPVFCVPGTSLAVAGIGSWVHGRVVWVALDNDASGQAKLQDIANQVAAFGGRCARAIQWPGHAKDACDVLVARGADAMSTFLARVTGKEVA